MDTAHSVQVCYIKEKTRHKRCNKRKEEGMDEDGTGNSSGSASEIYSSPAWPLDTAHSVQVCYIKEKTRHKRCNKRKEGKEIKHTGKRGGSASEIYSSPAWPLNTTHSVQVCYIKDETRHKRCRKRRWAEASRALGKGRTRAAHGSTTG